MRSWRREQRKSVSLHTYLTHPLSPPLLITAMLTLKDIQQRSCITQLSTRSCSFLNTNTAVKMWPAWLKKLRPAHSPLCPVPQNSHVLNRNSVLFMGTLGLVWAGTLSNPIIIRLVQAQTCWAIVWILQKLSSLIFVLKKLFIISVPLCPTPSLPVQPECVCLSIQWSRLCLLTCSSSLTPLSRAGGRASELHQVRKRKRGKQTRWHLSHITAACSSDRPERNPAP